MKDRLKLLIKKALRPPQEEMQKIAQKAIIYEQEKKETELLNFSINNSIYLTTLPKSGTTYTLHFLANYIKGILTKRGSTDLPPVNFSTLNNHYFFHSFESRIKEPGALIQLSRHDKIQKATNHKFNTLVHTHEVLTESPWSRCIILRRNPLDFLISAHNFWYTKRGIGTSNPMENYKIILEKYSKVVLKQNLILKNRPNDSTLFNYENLVTNPHDTFRKMLVFLEIEIFEELIEEAIINSSAKEIKKFEKATGGAIVADPQKFKGSFIRSGKTGEWKDTFTKDELDVLHRYLSKLGVGVSEKETQPSFKHIEEVPQN